MILLTAFSVVLGTLVIQGLTLKPLLRALNLNDDDPVGREVRTARERALDAGLSSLAGKDPAGGRSRPPGVHRTSRQTSGRVPRLAIRSVARRTHRLAVGRRDK